MKTVELCCPAGSGDHGPEKDCIGLPPFDLIEHLLIVQSKGAAIENRHVCGLLLSNKGSELTARCRSPQGAQFPMGGVTKRSFMISPDKDGNTKDENI